MLGQRHLHNKFVQSQNMGILDILIDKEELTNSPNVGTPEVDCAGIEEAGVEVLVDNEKFGEELAAPVEAVVLVTPKPVNDAVVPDEAAETGATVEALAVTAEEVAPKPKAGTEKEDDVVLLEGVVEALVVVTVENTGATDVVNDNAGCAEEDVIEEKEEDAVVVDVESVVGFPKAELVENEKPEEDTEKGEAEVKFGSEGEVEAADEEEPNKAVEENAEGVLDDEDDPSRGKPALAADEDAPSMDVPEADDDDVSNRDEVVLGADDDAPKNADPRLAAEEDAPKRGVLELDEGKEAPNPEEPELAPVTDDPNNAEPEPPVEEVVPNEGVLEDEAVPTREGPEAAVTEDPNNDKPEVAPNEGVLEAVPTREGPEAAVTEDPNNDEPEVAPNKGVLEVFVEEDVPNKEEPEAAVTEDPNNDEPEVAPNKSVPEAVVDDAVPNKEEPEAVTDAPNNAEPEPPVEEGVPNKGALEAGADEEEPNNGPVEEAPNRDGPELGADEFPKRVGPDPNDLNGDEEEEDDERFENGKVEEDCGPDDEDPKPDIVYLSVSLYRSCSLGLQVCVFAGVLKLRGFDPEIPALFFLHVNYKNKLFPLNCLSFKEGEAASAMVLRDSNRKVLFLASKLVKASSPLEAELSRIEHEDTWCFGSKQRLEGS
ncbi:hypothetical protein FNV43_RR18339 [Rhamnella rubrinervis]|uniref:Uncharacterized protein n=1 Tax=Rhamnella rubrinervis TaxID=2594499 RepID=A0A8K0E0K7_9ROSA|nr:hypothetical protein FNV43_RR18339 [Rhamnella rubrinervis]